MCRVHQCYAAVHPPGSTAKKYWLHSFFVYEDNDAALHESIDRDYSLFGVKGPGETYYY